MPKPLRIQLAIWSALLVLLAAGCSPTSADAGEGGSKPKVLTTFTVLADIARNVGGEYVAVESLTKVGAEIHGYEPTPGDVRRAADADLILDNGLNLELWFEQFVERVEVPHVVVSDGVEAMDIASDAYAGKPNPHAWMSPLNVKIYVDNIAAAFSKLDPDHADAFAANGRAYQAQLQSIHDKLQSELSTLPKAKRALVTCEGAFSYLARDAGLTERYIWPVNAEQQATPQQIAAVIDYVRSAEVPAVFCESTVSDKPMQQVVAATGTAFGGVLYVDSLSEAGGPVPTYLDLLQHDTDLIIQGLTGRER